jgi:ketosteroid isomerase-like protein
MLSRSLPVIALFALAACETKQARRTDTTSPATATLAGTPSADVAAVRQAIEANNAKFSAAAVQGDSVALAGMYADDAVLMIANMPAARGREAIARAFGGMVSAMKLSALKLDTQDVIVAGDYAVETGALDMTSQAKAKGAKPVHEVGKYLVVWKKQPDGSYKILRDIDNDDAPPK